MGWDQDQGQSEEVGGRRSQEESQREHDERWSDDAYEEDGEDSEVDHGKGKYRADENPTTQYESDEGTKHESKTKKYTSNFSTVSQDRTGGADEIEEHLLLLIGRMQGDPNLVSTKHGSKLIEDAAKLRENLGPPPPSRGFLLQPEYPRKLTEQLANIQKTGNADRFSQNAHVSQMLQKNPPHPDEELPKFTPGAPPPAVGTASGSRNHALEDYEMQLMLLEQQNKKRLMMARLEQDSMMEFAGQLPVEQQRLGSFKPFLTPKIQAPRLEINQNKNSSKPINSTSAPSWPSPSRHVNVSESQLTSEICRIINAPPNTNHQILLAMIRGLKEKSRQYDSLSSTDTENSVALQYQILHRVKCYRDSRKPIFGTYQRHPVLMANEDRSYHLHGGQPLTNLELFIERQRGISFVVFKDYVCCTIERPVNRFCPRFRDPVKVNSEKLSSFVENESMALISQDICDALKAMAEKAARNTAARPDGFYPTFEVGQEIPAPFFWYYHDRAFWKEQTPQLSGDEKRHVDLFLQYLEINWGKTYAKVDRLLGEKLITMKYLAYIYPPGKPLIQTKSNDGRENEMTRVYIQDAWLSAAAPVPPNAKAPLSQFRDRKHRSCRTLNAYSWSFDGSFQETRETLSVFYPDHSNEPFPIRGLNIYPLSFAEEGMEASIRARGRVFWSCREQRYVSYTENNSTVRYMIDMAAYRKMHPPKSTYNQPTKLRDDLGPAKMSQDEPPDGDFCLLLPSTIDGFNMNEKKWRTLQVDKISPIAWNTRAFEGLVMEDSTKELIEALVKNKIAADKNSDLISGKGNGLIVLLHGVAEIAEKPLYRVTCGDIGTDPEDVEKYLESVLYLGKIWNCVVLLDEADVFLEQRTLQDLQRNALVSGILLLTSNRVGTFDEAFKSRIQLALRYENLTENQRQKVWKNFIERLGDIYFTPLINNAPTDSELPPNIAELRANLPRLAKYDMNGRQIRNAITTARQLALFKKKSMGYTELKHVIDIAAKFDKYLVDVHEGLDADTIARSDNTR
ncbi:hypothetical protein CJF31_00009998 [Rutstroemia sp. NJR-2017a BVV2]|nr:hypothetical protein CJF31_00009998 [Rutstroemia sp. NJR-2017a BVV2]